MDVVGGSNFSPWNLPSFNVIKDGTLKVEYIIVTCELVQAKTCIVYDPRWYQFHIKEVDNELICMEAMAWISDKRVGCSMWGQLQSMHIEKLLSVCCLVQRMQYIHSKLYSPLL